jgi:ABC-type phosphate transport system substrate-binding protein
MQRRPLQLLLVLALASDVVAQPASSPVGYKVVVHPRNPLISAERSFIAEVFLKKVTRWRSGEVIKPVDLHRTSAVRAKFAEQVLGRSIAAIRSYWQQHIFAGRDLPPPELESDTDVLSYVLKYPGAIGYVSTAADVGLAKVIAVK